MEHPEDSGYFYRTGGGPGVMPEDPEPTETTLELALHGDERALERLVRRLTPIIARRVIRALVRVGRADVARQRDLARDLVQDVFLDLFANDAKILRDWRLERGLSFDNFVGLVAERRTLRRALRSPGSGESSTDGADGPEHPASGANPETEAVARAAWQEVLERVEEQLTPTGWHMFQLLFVEERSVDEIRLQTGLGRDAIYAWRSRLRKLARAVYEEAGRSRRGVVRAMPARRLASRGGA